MKTGFYNTHILSEIQQKELMKEAIYLSFKTEVQSKYSKRNDWRDIEPSVSISDALNTCTSLKVVDRTIQSSIKDDTIQGEISVIATSWKEPGWLLLYCYLSLPNLKILTKKYNLKNIIIK